MKRMGVNRMEGNFNVDSKKIEIVNEYKYLCVINEQLESRRVVEERAEAGTRC